MSYKTLWSLLAAGFLFLSAELTSAADIPFTLPKKSELNRLKSAIIYTEKGEIYIELFPEDAPWHIANLKYLADKGFYKNLTFHLYFPDYIIQGGDPTGSGNGGPGYSLPPEFSAHEHEPGTFGMARTKDSNNPERRSNGSQFHILMRPAPNMNRSYTVMGKVVDGMNVVRRLRKGDKILDLVVYVRKS